MGNRIKIDSVIDMTRWKETTAGFKINTRILLVCLAVIVVALGVLVFVSNSEATGQMQEGGSITYHLGDGVFKVDQTGGVATDPTSNKTYTIDFETGAFTESEGAGTDVMVTLSTYFGIRSTEYNPELWSGWGEVPRFNGNVGMWNWKGPMDTFTMTDKTITLNITSSTADSVITLPSTCTLDSTWMSSHTANLVEKSENPGSYYDNKVRIPSGTTSLEVTVDYSVKCHRVFGGWTADSAYDASSYPTGIVYPGDVVPDTVTDLYAIWIAPDIYAKKSQTFNTSGEHLAEDLQAYPYVIVNPASGTSRLSIDLSEYNSSSEGPGMFSTIYYLKSGTYYGIDSRSVLPAGTYRTFDPLKIYEKSTRQEVLNYKANVEISNRGDASPKVKISGDAVFDIIDLDTNQTNNHGGSGNGGLFATGHRLIMGTGISNKYSEQNNSYSFDTNINNRSPSVYGGDPGSNVTTAIENNKPIVFNDAYETQTTVNIGTFLIIHSGVYNSVFAGGMTQIGTSANNLSTYCVVKDCIVNDTLSGGNAGDKRTIYGSASGQSKTDGGTFLYLNGVMTAGDYWQDSESDYRGFVSGNNAGTIGNTREYIHNKQSSVTQGGNTKGTINGATHVFLSGDSSVWDIMAGCRDADSHVDLTYLEITGKAEVRRVACGTITDGSSNGNKNSVNHANIYVGEKATVATIYGAGFDTWAYPYGVSMVSGTIDIEIAGGRIGDVFGGGYRGSVGTTGNNPTSVDISIKITGGTVEGDVFGGGSGGLNKMKHDDNGNGFQTGSGTTGNQLSMGRSYVYGDIDIQITGGDILGNVYGGGMSVPKLKSYANSGTTSFIDDIADSSTNTPYQVASVFGNVSMLVSADAHIGGSVFGAGKGIVLDSSNKVVVSNYGFNKVLYKDGGIKPMYWVTGGVRTYVDDYSNSYENFARVQGNVTLTVGQDWRVGDQTVPGGTYQVSSDDAGADHFVVLNAYNDSLSKIPQHYTIVMVDGNRIHDVHTDMSAGDVISVNGNWYKGDSVPIGSEYTVAASDADLGKFIVLYTEKPSNYNVIMMNRGAVSMQTNLAPGSTVELGLATVDGSVYGGGGYSKIKGNTMVEVESAVIKNNVFGGGLGMANRQSTEGLRTVWINGDTHVTGSVYGGSQFGIDGTIIENIASDNTSSDVLNKLNRNKSVVVVQKGAIEGSVFGGGLMGSTYGNTEVYLGYRLTSLEVRSPSPNEYTGITSRQISVVSVFAGGNVSTGDSDVEVKDAYTEYLVQGTGTVKIYGNNNQMMSITGSIMGSGNACLTRGATQVDITNFYGSEQMTGIHRVDDLSINNSVLKITGRSPITPVFGQDKIVSLFKIKELTLKNGASIAFDAPIDDIGTIRSLTKDDIPSTATAPGNRMVFTSGSTVYVRSEGSDGKPTYNEVIGHVLMTTTQGGYGAYAIGKESSNGGFSITSEGSMKEANTSISDGVCIWYIAGISKKVITLELVAPNDDSMVSKESYITLSKFQADTDMVYTGGVFNKMSNDPNGDPYGFVRPGSEQIEDEHALMGLALGYNKTETGSMTLYDPTYRYMAINGTNPSSVQGTFYNKDNKETDISGDDRDRSLISVPMKYAGSESRTSGEFRLYMCLSGIPVNGTSYAGYLLLNFQEVKFVNYAAIGEGGSIIDTPRSLVAHTIEVRVDIYVYSNSSVEEDNAFSVEIKTYKDDEELRSGESSTLIPQSYSMAETTLKSVSYIGAGSGWMPSDFVVSGNSFTLPDCRFYAPGGKTFAGWSVDGSEDLKLPGESITVTGDVSIEPRWTAKSLVVFDPNEGSGFMASAFMNAGTVYKLPESTFTAPSSGGKSFGHWSISTGDDRPLTRYPGESITITGDTVIRAIWGASKTVTFSPGSSGSGTIDSATVAVNERFTLPYYTGFTPNDGYNFLRWSVKVGNDNAMEKQPGDTVKIKDDTTVTAIWSNSSTYRISFDPNGGVGIISSVNVAAGSAYRLSEPVGVSPPEEQHFLKWLVSINGGSDASYYAGEYVTVTNNTLAKAIWTNEVTVEFLKSDGSKDTGTMADVNTSHGSTYIIPKCSFTESGKTFSHWIWVLNNTEYYPGQMITATEDVNTGKLTLKAVFTDDSVIDYRIIFQSNGGTGTMPTLKRSNSATGYTLPLCGFTAPAEMVFNGWDTAGLTVTNGTVIFKDSKDVVLRATWTATGSTTRSVEFKETASSGATLTKTVANGVEIALPGNIFALPEGKKFTAWSVKVGDSAAVEKQPGSTITVSANTVITPVFADKGTDKSISYDSGITIAGTVSVFAKSNEDNTSGWSNIGNRAVVDLSTGEFTTYHGQMTNGYIGTLLGNIVGNVGFTVDGMSFKDSQGDFFFPVIDLEFERKLMDGTVMEAHTYLTFSDMRYYTVYYVDHGFTTEKQYIENTRLTRELCEEPSGTNFNGWYIDSKYVNRYDYNTIINDGTDGMTLYARYTYVVTLDNMNGTSLQLHVSQEDNGALLGKNDLPTPVYQGYVFKGWCKDKELIYDWAYQSDRVTEDMTLYARWSGKDVRVYFWYDDEDGYLRLFEGGHYEVIMLSTAGGLTMNPVTKDKGEIVDLAGYNLPSGYSWYVVKDNSSLSPLGSVTSYTVSESDIFTDGSNKIYLLANNSSSISSPIVLCETRFGTVPQAISSGTIQPLGDLPNAEFKGWKLMTGLNKGAISNSYTYNPADADHSIILLKAVWNELAYDFSKAYQMNESRAIYPTLKWGSSFDLMDPYHAESILDYARDNILIEGQFVKWSVRSPTDPMKTLGIYSDTIVGSKVMQYVTDEMLVGYDGLWDYYTNTNKEYKRMEWTGPGSAPEVMEIHLKAESTNIALKVVMGLKEEDMIFKSSVTIADPHEFLVYPNGPILTYYDVVDGKKVYHDEFEHNYYEGDVYGGEVLFYWNEDRSARYYYDDYNNCWTCVYVDEQGIYELSPECFESLAGNHPEQKYYNENRSQLRCYNLNIYGIIQDYSGETPSGTAYTKSFAYRLVEEPENSGIWVEKKYLVEWKANTNQVLKYMTYEGTYEKGSDVYPKYSVEKTSTDQSFNESFYLKHVDTGQKFKVVHSPSSNTASITQFVLEPIVLTGSYEFIYELNDAVRNGYTLLGWHNDYISLNNSSYPGPDMMRTIHITVDKDGYTRCAMIMKRESNGEVSRIPLLVGDYVVDSNDADAGGHILIVKSSVTMPDKYTFVVFNENEQGTTIGTQYEVGMSIGIGDPGTNRSWMVKDAVVNMNEYVVSSYYADAEGNIIIRSDTTDAAALTSFKVIKVDRTGTRETVVSGVTAGTVVNIGSATTGYEWMVKNRCLGPNTVSYTVSASDADAEGNILIKAVIPNNDPVSKFTVIKVVGNTRTTVGVFSVDQTVALGSPGDGKIWWIGHSDKVGYTVKASDANSMSVISMWSIANKVDSYTVNVIDVADHNRIIKTGTYSVGETVALDNLDDRGDNHFIGWKAKSGFIMDDYIVSVKDLWKENNQYIIKIESVWESTIPSEAKYRAVFVTEFGEPLEPIANKTVPNDPNNPTAENMVTLDTLTKSGYRNTGWKIISGDIVKTVSGSTYIIDASDADESKDIILEAIWNKEYKVKISNDGTSGSEETHAVGTIVELDYSSAEGWRVSDGTIVKGGKINDAADTLTFTYRANWQVIDYKLHLTQPANGHVDLFLEDRNGNGGLTFLPETNLDDMDFFYGDKIQLSYTPANSTVQFIKWIITGEYYISNINDPNATIVLQGDCSISVDESTGSIIDLMITFDNGAEPNDGNQDEWDRTYTRIFLRDKETGEYFETRLLPGMVDQDHYTAKVPYGTYEVCMWYGWTLPMANGECMKLPTFDVPDEYVLVGDVPVTLGGTTTFIYDLISAGFIDSLAEEYGLTNPTFVDSKYGIIHDERLQEFTESNIKNSDIYKFVKTSKEALNDQSDKYCHPIRIVLKDSDENDDNDVVVAKMTRYVGAQRPILMSLDARGLNINNPNGSAPPVVLEFDTNLTYSTYEGFPWYYGGSPTKNAFAINVENNLSIDTDSNTQSTKRFYLNWVRTDSPADVMIKLKPMDEPDYYVLATIQMKNDNGDYETLQTGIEYKLVKEQAATFYEMDYPIQTYEGYDVVPTITVSDLGTGGEVTFSPSTGLLHLKVNADAAHISKSSVLSEHATITISHNRSEAYYAYNDNTFANPRIGYDKSVEPTGHEEWGTDITLPSTFMSVQTGKASGYTVNGYEWGTSTLLENYTLQTGDTKLNHGFLVLTKDKYANCGLSGITVIWITEQMCYYETGKTTGYQITGYLWGAESKANYALQNSDIRGNFVIVTDKAYADAGLSGYTVIDMGLPISHWKMFESRTEGKYVEKTNDSFVYKVTREDAINTADFEYTISDIGSSDPGYGKFTKVLEQGGIPRYYVDFDDTNIHVYALEDLGKRNILDITLYKSWTCKDEDLYRTTDTDISTVYTDSRMLFIPLTTSETVDITFITNYMSFDVGKQRVDFDVTVGGTMSDYRAVEGMDTVSNFIAKYTGDTSLEYIFNGFYSNDGVLFDPTDTTYVIDEDTMFIARWTINENGKKTFTYHQDGENAEVAAVQDAVVNSNIPVNTPTKVKEGGEITISIQPDSGYVLDLERTKAELGKTQIDQTIYHDVTIAGKPTVIGHQFQSWKIWGDGLPIPENTEMTLDDESVKNDFIALIAQWDDSSSGKYGIIYVTAGASVGNLVYSDSTSITLRSGSWKLWGEGDALSGGSTINLKQGDIIDGYVVVTASDFRVEGTDIVVFASEYGEVSAPYGAKHYYVDKYGSKFYKDEPEYVYKFNGSSWEEYRYSKLTGKDGNFIKQFTGNGTDYVYKSTRDSEYYGGAMVSYTVEATTPADSTYPWTLTGDKVYHIKNDGSVYLFVDGTNIPVSKAFYKTKEFKTKMVYSDFVAGTVYSADFDNRIDGFIEFYMLNNKTYEIKSGNTLEDMDGVSVNPSGLLYKDVDRSVDYTPNYSTDSMVVVYSKSNDPTIQGKSYLVKDHFLYEIEQYGSSYINFETASNFYDGMKTSGSKYKDNYGTVWVKNSNDEFMVDTVTVYVFDPQRSSETAVELKYNTSTGELVSGILPKQYYLKDQYGNHIVGNYLTNFKVNVLYLKVDSDITTLYVKYIEDNEYVKALYLTSNKTGDPAYLIKKNGEVVTYSDKTVVNGNLYHHYNGNDVSDRYVFDYSITFVNAKYNVRTEYTVNGIMYYKDAFGNVFEDWLGTPTQLSGNRGYTWTFFVKDDIDMTIYTKKLSYNIYFIINGVRVSPSDLNRVSTVAPISHTPTSEDFYGKDIPAYTIVAFDGPDGNRDIVWYTDPAYTQKYDIHNGGYLLKPNEFIVDMTLPEALRYTDALGTHVSGDWKLWGTDGTVGPYKPKDTDAHNGFVVLVSSDYGTELKNYTVMKITMESSNIVYSVETNVKEGHNCPGTWRVWGAGTPSSYNVSKSDSYNGFIVLVASNVTLPDTTKYITVTGTGIQSVSLTDGEIAGSWKVWGGTAYKPESDVVLNMPNCWKGIDTENYYYIFEADWGETHNEAYRIVYATNYGILESNLDYSDSTNITLKPALSVTDMTFYGWKVWNSGEPLVAGSAQTIQTEWVRDGYVLFVADWGEDLTNANNIVFASNHSGDAIPNMESIRKYQFLSTENQSLYGHLGSYILYLHDYYDNPDRTVEYELMQDENRQITIPIEHYDLENYFFVGWSTVYHSDTPGDPNEGKRLYTYIPGENVIVTKSKVGETMHLYPYYLGDGSLTRYYNGKQSDLKVDVDEFLQQTQIRPDATVLKVEYWDDGWKETRPSVASGVHAGEYEVRYRAVINTPLKSGDGSYGNTEMYHAIPESTAHLTILQVDAYAIAPSEYIRDGENGNVGIEVTADDITTIGLVPTDYTKSLSTETGYGNNRSDPGVTHTRAVINWNGFIALVKSDFALSGYTVIKIDGTTVTTATGLTTSSEVDIPGGDWALWGSVVIDGNEYTPREADATLGENKFILLMKSSIQATGLTVVIVNGTDSGSFTTGMAEGETVTGLTSTYFIWGKSSSPVTGTYTIHSSTDANGYMWDKKGDKYYYELDYNLRYIDGSLVVYTEDATKHEYVG